MSLKHFDPGRPKKATDLQLGYDEYIPGVNRNSWGAKEQKNFSRLTHPATIVRFTTTGGFTCEGHEMCVSTLKNLQLFHIDSGLSDIRHNYLVGGNGVVYEGRGLNYQPILPEEFAQLSATCIDIAFIGKFEFEDPPYEMTRLALDLIRFAVKKKALHPNFDLIPLQPCVKKEDKSTSGTPPPNL